jgi:hypothetical protein
MQCRSRFLSNRGSRVYRPFELCNLGTIGVKTECTGSFLGAIKTLISVQ